MVYKMGVCECVVLLYVSAFFDVGKILNIKPVFAGQRAKCIFGYIKNHY